MWAASRARVQWYIVEEVHPVSISSDHRRELATDLRVPDLHLSLSVQLN